MASRPASKPKKKSVRAAPLRIRASARAPRPAVERPRRLHPGDIDLEAPRLFAKIEEAAGRGVRRTAERAAARTLEFFVRCLGHYLMNGFGGLLYAEPKLQARLAEPELDRAAIAELVASQLATARRLKRTMSRAREAVLREPRHMCEEPVAPLVEEVRAAVVGELGARASRFELAVQIEEGLSLHADHPYLFQALVDLVKNGAEAYPETRSSFPVRLTARGRGRTVEIVVEDDGRGWDPETLVYAYKPFGSGKPEGSGLGLYIARRAVEEIHGGKLVLSSEGYEKGLRVRIVLPRRQRNVQERRRFTINEILTGAERRYREAKKKERDAKKRGRK